MHSHGCQRVDMPLQLTAITPMSSVATINITVIGGENVL